jgi:hypothetical protein
MKTWKMAFTITLLTLCFILPSCGDETDESVIPDDPGGSAPTTTINNVLPSATFDRGSGKRIILNLLGIIDPITGNPFGFQANQTVFITEDSILKGIKVTTVGSGSQLSVDIIFTVDNSGSMGDEADSIAVKIISFVTYLESRGLNVRVGCVGYDGNVTGALNLTTENTLTNYLNRPYYTGTSRTEGFSGPDSASLYTKANSWASGVYGENGIVAILYADTFFSWRANSQRVFINFTDEPTQPSGYVQWSTGFLCSHWNSDKGTIHTVFSEDTTGMDWTPLEEENPLDLSFCTGGTTKIIPYDAAGLNLTDLPVTGALTNSAKIEFNSSNPGAAHTLTITVKNGTTADGKRVYQNISY